MKRILLLLILSLGFLPTTLYAQIDNQVILGDVSPNQLKIQINSGGNYCVYRWLNNSWNQQFYSQYSHLFAIKIGDTTFTSGRIGTSTHLPDAGSLMTGVNIAAFNSIVDVGTPVTSGVIQEMTKRFTGTYNGNSFTVTLKITYNTSAPDYFIKHVTVDATNIPVGTPITLAYGWDTYVNISDAGYAYILPDIFSLNDNLSVENRYLTTEQMQSLRMVGARNNTGNGAFIAFFTIGRDFDRGYSSNHYNQGYCFNVPTLTPGAGGDTGFGGTSASAASQYMFQFGPFSGGRDNGTGVGYDNIPAGTITTIETGLTFTAALHGELDYFWNGVKNYTANIGDNVTLNLNYTCHSPVLLTDVGFRVNHTGLQISGACTSSGFAGGTSNCTSGNEFYQLNGASVAAMGTGAVSIPVNIVRAGKWVVDGNSISNMTQTLPLGSQAILTVNTTVSLSDNSAVVLSVNNNSHLFTVKFPDAVVANEDVTVNINYSGDISDFSFLPSSVVIPAGQNSATFTVTAASDATNGSSIIVILSGTNKEFATIAPFDSAVVNYVNLPDPSCNACPASFAPLPGKKYVFSGWVKDAEALENNAVTYENCFATLTGDKFRDTIPPSGSIIDGWQRMQKVINVPSNAYKMRLELVNNTEGNVEDAVFFDDIRVYPFNGNMKSYVYDPITRRLVAELDDENYATIYEYDEEGALIRVKKETERGVMTIREARQGQRKQ